MTPSLHVHLCSHSHTCTHTHTSHSYILTYNSNKGNNEIGREVQWCTLQSLLRGLKPAWALQLDTASKYTDQQLLRQKRDPVSESKQKSLGSERCHVLSVPAASLRSVHPGQ